MYNSLINSTYYKTNNNNNNNNINKTKIYNIL